MFLVQQFCLFGSNPYDSVLYFIYFLGPVFLLQFLYEKKALTLLKILHPRMVYILPKNTEMGLSPPKNKGMPYLDVFP